MSRQVDIKSLVSHIIRGDGMDKCRICMGDTSQGQVHLTDTVMMDGDKAVTLSELLEVITGVEVECEEALPSAICLTCSIAAIAAAEFRALVQRAKSRWSGSVRLLQHIPDCLPDLNTKKILAFLSRDAITIVDEKPKQSNEKPQEPTIKRFGKTRSCQCPVCDKKFNYASLLHNHLKESADLIRACHICGAVMSRDNLVKHLKESHEIKPYDCKKCPALFVNMKPYTEHVLKAHAPGMRTCGDCCRSFKSQPAFRAHQAVHSRRSCPNCDKQFQNQMCYTHHVQKCCKLDSKNSDPKTVILQNKQNKKVRMGKRGSTNSKCICDYCNKPFSAKKYVAAHIAIVHTKSTHRPCPRCGKLLAAARMSSHARSHAAQRYQCAQCGALLKSKLGFHQHLRLHSGERPYRCPHCGEAFSAASRRSEHIRKKHLETQAVLRHGCTLCPARFRLPGRLRVHVRKVHRRRRPGAEEFRCADCHEMFATCRSLHLHSSKH